MYEILMNECQNKQQPNDPFMTSSFGLSGKNLINFSRGLLILFLMQFHLLSLTPCHIARRQSTNKTLFKTIQAKKNDFQFLVLYTCCVFW